MPSSLSQYPTIQKLLDYLAGLGASTSILVRDAGLLCSGLHIASSTNVAMCLSAPALPACT